MALAIRNICTSIFGWGPMDLGRLRSVLIVLLFFTSHQSPGAARENVKTSQEEAPIVLTHNARQRKQITRGQSQYFSLDLQANQLAQLVFQWEGLNLNVGVRDPSDRKLFPSDISVASPGPVSIWILAETSGVFKLEITAAVRQKISGTYEVIFQDLRSASPSDSNYVRAQTLIAEGSSSSNIVAKIDKYNQASLLWQNLGAGNEEARTFLLLGEAYRNNSELDTATRLSKATNSYERAAAIWKREGYVKGQGYAELSLGSLNQFLGSASDALKHYEEAQTLFVQISDGRGQASALYGQAFAQMVTAQTPQAIQNLLTAVSIRRTQGDRIGEANALNILADANRIMGNFDEALALYGQANEALRGMEHTSMQASLINGTVLVYDDWGDWQRAKEGYLHAIDLLESLLGAEGLKVCHSPPAVSAGVCRMIATALDNLGETYNSLGEPDRALVEFNKALIVRDALAQPLGQGATRFHIGYSHYLREDSGRALEFYNSALAYQQTAGDQKGIALTYAYMGMAHTALHQPDKALDLYKKALPILEKSEDKRAQAITLDKIGSVLAVLKNSAGSEEAYNKALGLWRSVKDTDGEALTRHHRASAMRAAGDLKKANEYIANAIKLVETLRTEVTNQRLRASYLANKANYYELEVSIKMQLWRTQNRQQDLAGALEANEKARARVLLDALNEAGVGRSVTAESSDPRFSLMIEQRLKLLSSLAAKAQTRTRLLSGAYSPEQISSLDRELQDLSDKYDEDRKSTRLN